MLAMDLMPCKISIFYARFGSCVFTLCWRWPRHVDWRLFFGGTEDLRSTFISLSHTISSWGRGDPHPDSLYCLLRSQLTKCLTFSYFLIAAYLQSGHIAFKCSRSFCFFVVFFLSFFLTSEGFKMDSIV